LTIRRATWAVTHPSYVWGVVALATLGQGASNAPIQTLRVLFPFMQDEIGLSRTDIGLIVASLAGGATFTISLGGWLADRWGVRWVAGFTLVTLALPLLGLTIANGLFLLMVFALLAGMLQAPGFPATARAVLDWVPQRNRAMAMGIKHMGVPVIGSIGALALPAIAVAAGWRWSVAVLAGFIFVSGLIFVMAYRDRPREVTSTAGSLRGSFAELAKDRTLATVTIWALVLSGVSIIASTFFVLFLVEEAGTSKITAGGLAAVMAGGSIAGRFAWGLVSDALMGSRRVLILGIMGGLTVLALAGLAIVPEGTPITVFGFLGFLLGLTTLSWRTVLVVLVGEMATPGRMGTTIGAVSTLMSLGALGGGPLFGQLVDSTGSYPIGWGVTAAAAAASTLGLLLVARDPRPLDTQERLKPPSPEPAGTLP
jgi:sugar phosphate permease